MSWLTVVLWCAAAIFVFLAVREANVKLSRTPHGRPLDITRYLAYLLPACALVGFALRLTFNDSFLMVVLLYVGILGALTLVVSSIVDRRTTARMAFVVIAAIFVTVGTGLWYFLQL